MVADLCGKNTSTQGECQVGRRRCYRVDDPHHFRTKVVLPSPRRRPRAQARRPMSIGRPGPRSTPVILARKRGDPYDPWRLIGVRKPSSSRASAGTHMPEQWCCRSRRTSSSRASAGTHAAEFERQNRRWKSLFLNRWNSRCVAAWIPVLRTRMTKRKRMRPCLRKKLRPKAASTPAAPRRTNPAAPSPARPHSAAARMSPTATRAHSGPARRRQVRRCWPHRTAPSPSRYPSQA